jgi:transketolase
MILARTRKGEGIPAIVDKPGHHGKPLTPEQAAPTIAELRTKLSDPPPPWTPVRFPERAELPPVALESLWKATKPPYEPGSPAVATRKAFGEALAALGKQFREIVALDGDVKNSTYTELLEKVAPEQFSQMYIAEQNMVGAAMGLAAAGRIPFAATFACFLTRAYDFLRMAAIGGTNIKVVGSHAGVSIGEDGPSQMGLEDLAMCCAMPDFTVLYPSDAVSTWRATALVAALRGPCYLRTSRPATPILYGADEPFEVGKCKVVRRNRQDVVTVIAAGVALFEALRAHDELEREQIHVRVIDLFSVQPLDREAIASALTDTKGRLVTVEDHYRRGGLGEAVCAAAADEGIALTARLLAVRDIPRSGSPEELMDLFGISAPHIVRAVKSLL